MGANREWLVTDQCGGFAMGTLEGVRTRKYHGFYLGVSGRAEAAFLATFEVEIDGKRLWPCDPSHVVETQINEWGPRWVWNHKDGVISFQVLRNSPAGIRLTWNWSGGHDLPFRLRPLFAMRELHETEGNFWSIQHLGRGTYRVEGRSDRDLEENRVFCRWSQEVQWRDDPHWFANFHYAQESERGHIDHEKLYSAGIFEACLCAGGSLTWVASQRCEDVQINRGELSRAGLLKRSDYPYPALDFVLDNPAGIVAGYPWFGELGRDTFVSLPGIVCARLAVDEDVSAIKQWVYELLERWGSWIETTGMIPHVMEREGSHEWDSADGTLWFCHSLAALWVLALDKSEKDPELFPDLEQRFGHVLRAAIRSILEGRHLFLRVNARGLLEVTEGHVTWMDARIDGAPVGARTGVLPEINALWFQARFLNFLWGGEEALYELEQLGKEVLKIREPDRPNDVFLHSLPLAPSFILKDWSSLRADLKNLRHRFLTTVGLRSLAPDHPDYRGHIEGTQGDRELAYHQGGSWAWLKGHFQMAENRMEPDPQSNPWPSDLPIEGHIPEVFDGDAPHESRGAPAQAWSLACDIENRTRKARGLDTKLSRILARLWMKDVKRA